MMCEADLVIGNSRGWTPLSDTLTLSTKGRVGTKLQQKVKEKKMRNTSALHWTLLVALLASPVGASAQSTTDDQEPDDSR